MVLATASVARLEGEVGEGRVEFGESCPPADVAMEEDSIPEDGAPVDACIVAWAVDGSSIPAVCGGDVKRTEIKASIFAFRERP